MRAVLTFGANDLAFRTLFQGRDHAQLVAFMSIKTILRRNSAKGGVATPGLRFIQKCGATLAAIGQSELNGKTAAAIAAKLTELYLSQAGGIDACFAVRPDNQRALPVPVPDAISIPAYRPRRPHPSPN